MKKVYLTLSLVLLLSPVTFAANSTAEQPVVHMYKGEPLSEDLFDKNQPSGLNLGKVMEDLKTRRARGESSGFSTTVTLYAGTNDKIKKEVNSLRIKMDQLSTMKRGKTKNALEAEIAQIKQLIEALKESQKTQRQVLQEAGLMPEQIAKIPGLSEFLKQKTMFIAISER